MFSFYEGLAFRVHGSADHAGVAALVGDFLAKIEGLATHSDTGESVSSLLPGIAGMANVHPLAVHFPIALLTMFFVVELASFCFGQKQWRPVASGLLYLGTVCAAVAVYLGLQAAETVAHDEAVHVIMEKHEAFGIAILSVAMFLSLWRLFFNVHRYWVVQLCYLFLATVLNVLVVLGADLGGVMVYQHAVAVKIPVATSITTPAVVPEVPHEHGHAGHDHNHGSHTH